MRIVKLGIALWLIGCTILLTGCVTKITKPAALPQPSTERFGTFDTVEFEKVSIAPKFAKSDANQKAAKKINEELMASLNNVFPGMTVADPAAKPTKGKMLVIRPVIKEIKFIGGGARFWLGAMAGSSAVLMQVSFVDKETGAVLANPEFYRAASAMGGGWSIGGTDNMMLTTIVQDITTYTSSNR